MIKFLARLFGAKEELKQLKKSELESYIKKQLDNNNINSLLKEFSGRIDEISETIKERCDELEKAELQNKNIPPRAITIMEGNRNAYIHKTMHFTGKIREILSEIQTLADSDIIIDNISKISEMLDEYNKTTQKPYYILQEFFANESHKVALGIKEISDLIQQFRENLKQSDAHKFQEILSLLNKIRNREQRRKELENQKKELEKNLNEEEKNILILKHEIKKIKESSEFNELAKLNDKLKIEKDEQNRLSDEIYYKLAPLSRALRKYAKISFDEKSVEIIIFDPFKAMAEIETAKLNEIFLRLTKNIKERKIGLKDNVQKKNLLILNELNPGFLRDMQTKIKIQMENIKNLSIEIGKNTLWSKIEELNKEIEKKQQHLSNISREILNTEHEISKITTDDVDKKIIDILKSLNIELVEE
ncbi:hypothetical protein COV14_05740 [Candidatus Woesearchaeota archaeon CG10_big_fil_rev_8_21_14_0_10_33_12]|nr:MAG: hypothetical protein COV14_05740 [Candidatus Woesearchaeota archaeon CG10_big_fil_rev_8_21_14_0_10_33_12]